MAGSRTVWRVLLVAAAVHLTGCGLWRSGGLTDRSVPLGGPCARIQLKGGPEDLAPDGRGGVYVSASDWRGRQQGSNVERGALYRLDLDPATGAPRLTDLTPASPVDFQPHGLDLWTAPDGAQRLFVVNHPLTGPSRVEIFSITSEGLRDTGEGGAWPLLHRPNDLAAYGPASFFASNDHAIRRRWWFHPRLTEQWVDMTGWPNGYLVRVDGEGAHVAVARLALPNGVARSPDGARLYVAESAAGRVRVYDASEPTRLVELPSLDPGPAPDNIVVGRDGLLWIGAHNNGLDLLREASTPEHPSPGRVVQLSPSGQRGVVYQSGRALTVDGPSLWSVSAGAPLGTDRVVVGAIFPHRLEVCRIQQTPAKR